MSAELRKAATEALDLLSTLDKAKNYWGLKGPGEIAAKLRYALSQPVEQSNPIHQAGPASAAPLLTRERIEEIFQSCANDDPDVHQVFARAIEAEITKPLQPLTDKVAVAIAEQPPFTEFHVLDVLALIRTVEKAHGITERGDLTP